MKYTAAVPIGQILYTDENRLKERRLDKQGKMGNSVLCAATVLKTLITIQ